MSMTVEVKIRLENQKGVELPGYLLLGWLGSDYLYLDSPDWDERRIVKVDELYQAIALIYQQYLLLGDSANA